ncbi:MAG: arsenate reductase ArsC [Methanobacterium sp.]
MNDLNTKKSILFICKNNSGRSQMAEGLLKRAYGDKFNVYSGGIDPKEVNPMTIEVMAEIGIDISHYSSTNVVEYQGREFDYVITICDDENCPVFLDGKKFIFHEFNDPKTYSNGDIEKMDIFRNIRDEIKDWIENSLINEIGLKNLKWDIKWLNS